jgi:hypothetical protein
VRPGESSELYSHYPNKAALMDAVLDSLLGDIETPDLDGLDWRDGLVAVMNASRRMLLTHADLLPLLFARPMRGPNVIRLGEQTLALLARGGITGPEAVVALRAMLMLTSAGSLSMPREWPNPILPDARRRATPPSPSRRSARGWPRWPIRSRGPLQSRRSRRASAGSSPASPFDHPVGDIARICHTRVA